MTSVAFFVDGDLEQKFIHEICKGNPIRKIGNGDAFPVHIIAKQIATQKKLLSNRIEKFIVLMDLEDRPITCDEFAKQIRDALINQGCVVDDIFTFIKKRDIENWILADALAISHHVDAEVDCSGLFGKGGLKRILRQHDITYNETTIGVTLLKKVHCSRAVLKSDSLKYLVDNLPITCWWTKR